MSIHRTLNPVRMWPGRANVVGTYTANPPPDEATFLHSSWGSKADPTFSIYKIQIHKLANVLHFAKALVFLVWSARRLWSERTPKMRPVWSDPTLKCGRNVHRRSNITMAGHILVGVGPDRRASWPARRAFRPRCADGSKTSPQKSGLVARINALSRATCHGGSCQT